MQRRLKVILVSFCLLAFAGLWSVGVLDVYAIGIAALLLSFIVVVFWKKGFALTLLASICFLAFTFILSDLFLRVALPGYLYYRPHEMFIQKWPLRPYLVRYKSNVSYAGTTYGDLAAFSGRKVLQEQRPIAFITDGFGFRNDPAHEAANSDVIVLGDSFGVGNGTTQDAVWVNVLKNKYDLHIYNLSMAPGSPWRHFLNLVAEFDRLKVRPGTVVLLTLFTGNDLDEYFGKTNILAQLPENGAFERFKLTFNSFRRRSPIARLGQKLMAMAGRENRLQPDRASQVEIVKFINGRETAFFTPYVASARRTETDIRQHRNFERLQDTLKDTKAFCDKNGLDLKVALFPSKYEVYGWVLERGEPWSTEPVGSNFSKTVSSLCADYDIPYLDMLPQLVVASRALYEESGELLWWFDDTHPNEKGHEKIADGLFKDLLSGQLDSPLQTTVSRSF